MKVVGGNGEEIDVSILCRSSRNPGAIRVLRTIVVVAVLGIALAAAGCSGGSSSGSGYGAAPATPASAPTQATSAVATAAVQTCLECGTKKMPAMVVGSAQVVNGVQVVNVAIQGGTYVPNKITVKAGMPVQVVFAGSAKGCLAKPMFKSLGKNGDVTASGAATIDLGALPKGTYKFTCAMGMNAGSIIAQ